MVSVSSERAGELASFLIRPISCLRRSEDWADRGQNHAAPCLPASLCAIAIAVRDFYEQIVLVIAFASCHGG